MNKSEIRQQVWDALQAEGAAAFPFPPHGRIPNFRGAAEAARRLAETTAWRAARVVKVNPDAPQQPVRERAILDGKTLVMPTPRLRDGFMLLRPEDVPPGEERRAVTIRHLLEYGRVVDLLEVPRIDLFVCGSVAVDGRGHRAGKGEGYSDREYAVLMELGMPPMPVATTVHRLQVVESVPRDPHDLVVDIVATPEAVWETRPDAGNPRGIDWAAVREAELEAMPVLARLREIRHLRGRADGRTRRDRDPS